MDAEVARATVLLHHDVVVLHKDREAIVRVAATGPTTEVWTGVAIMALVAMSCHVTLTRS